MDSKVPTTCYNCHEVFIGGIGAINHLQKKHEHKKLNILWADVHAVNRYKAMHYTYIISELPSIADIHFNKETCQLTVCDTIGV